MRYRPIAPIEEEPEGPLISVIVPTRNRADLLERLLDALERQRYPRREVIVVDDASTDGTHQALRRRDATVLRQDQSRGSYVARNRGWRAAQGEIIAFTDDDCMPHPEWLTALARAFQDSEHVVGVQGPVLATPGEITPFTHQIVHTRPGPPYRTANIAYRRVTLEQLGGFDERFRWYADNLLGYRAQGLGTVAFAPDALVFHPPRRREWRTQRDWLARFQADAAHREQLQALGVEPRVAPAAALPLALWVARPILKQLGAHLRYAARHPGGYAHEAVPMAREKVAMARAMRQYWKREPMVEPAEPLPPLPTNLCISVVVVTRERPTVKDTMVELVRQSWSSREIVLVEHGGDALRDFGAQFGARYVSVPASATLGAARQAGVDAASGGIVAFTDDDCLPHVDWLAAIARGFETHPELWGLQGRTLAEVGPADTYAVRVPAPDRLYRTCNIAYRRAAIEHAGGFDTGFMRWFEDTALGARIEAHGPIGFDDAMRVTHRAMPRRPLTPADWRTLLRDERRLERCYPEFYRTVRGPGFWRVVVARWLVGSAIKTAVRAMAKPGGSTAYVRLLRLLIEERVAFLRAVPDLWRAGT